MRRVTALAAVLAAMASAPVLGGQASYAASRPTRAPARAQRCGPAREPRALPALSQLVDSTTLGALLAGESATGRGAFTMQFSQSGELAHLLPVGGTLPDTTLARLARGLAALVEPQPPRSTPWGVRLDVDLGTAPVLRVQRSEYCEPLQQRSLVALTELQNTLNATTLGVAAHGETLIRVAIDGDGQVVLADVVRSGLPAAVEQVAIRTARAVTYEPALRDRVPVVATDSLLLRVDADRGVVVFGSPRYIRP